jgi:hypothetical protein
MRRLLLVALLTVTVAGAGVSPARATAGGHRDVRFATYNLSLNRPVAGMLREQLAAPDVDDVYRRQARNVAEVIQRAHPDVVLVNEFDFDPEAARLFAENFLAVSQNGAPAQRYPYRYVLGRRIRPSISAAAVLPGADVADHEALVVEAARRHGMVRIPQPVIRRLAMLYGDHSPVPVAIMASQPALGQPLDAAGTITGAEIIYAIKNEMAVRLTDIVMRRLSLSMARPADVVVRGCAQVAAAELGWTDAELNEEIAELDRAYQVP